MNRALGRIRDFVWASPVLRHMSTRASRQKGEATQNPAETAIPASIQSQSDGRVRIIIHAKPGAKLSAIKGVFLSINTLFDLVCFGTPPGITAESVEVEIAAPPTEGQANEELVDFMAQILSLKKRQVSLERGAKSRSKILVIEDLPPQQVHERLKRACDSA